jgi:putative effector of murein hydrolase LrgA (UPF0299 family)
VLLDAENFGLSEGMRPAFFFSIIAFTLLYVTLLAHRVRLERLQEEVDGLKEQAAYA